jgi:hypothetical protein
VLEKFPAVTPSHVADPVNSSAADDDMPGFVETGSRHEFVPRS